MYTYVCVYRYAHAQPRRGRILQLLEPVGSVLSLDILQLLEPICSGENLDRVHVRLERVRISLLLDLPHELHEVLFREGKKRGCQQFTDAASASIYGCCSVCGNTVGDVYAIYGCGADVPGLRGGIPTTKLPRRP